MQRSSARRITAVIPYYGYARQDKKVAPRVPISAKLVADLLTRQEPTESSPWICMPGQIQGFFNIPVDNLFAAPVIIKYIRNKFTDDMVIVSPDAGGVERARAFAKSDCMRGWPLSINGGTHPTRPRQWRSSAMWRKDGGYSGRYGGYCRNADRSGSGAD